jgi:hypothetical protein
MKYLLILVVILMTSCGSDEYRVKTSEGIVTAYNEFEINGLTVGDSIYVYATKSNLVYNTWIIAREFGPDTSYKYREIQVKFMRGRIIRAL